MADLSVTMAGLEFKNPLMVGAGPNTKNVPTVLACMKAGFGAVVVRSLHVQTMDQEPQSSREFWRVYGTGTNYRRSLYSFQSSGAPALRVNPKVAPGHGGAAPAPSLEQWTEEVHKMTRAANDYDCRIIASNGWCGTNLSTKEVWQAEAKAMTEAGVDAIQLHTGPSPATEPGRFMMYDPAKYLEMPIRATKEVTDLPVFAKIPVDCCDAVTMSAYAEAVGADGVVPVTRWLSIPIDVEDEKAATWRGPGIGGPWSVPIMNGLIYRLRHADRPLAYLYGGASDDPLGTAPISVPIVPSGGVRFGSDVIGYLMAGADAAEICAQVILEGVGMAGRVEQEMRDWMDRKGYRRISDFQGILRLLEPSQRSEIPQWVPVVDEALCSDCDVCVKACVDEAISLVSGTAQIDLDYCEGCRTCFLVCPKGAITLTAGA